MTRCHTAPDNVNDGNVIDRHDDVVLCAPPAQSQAFDHPWRLVEVRYGGISTVLLIVSGLPIIMQAIPPCGLRRLGNPKRLVKLLVPGVTKSYKMTL